MVNYESEDIPEVEKEVIRFFQPSLRESNARAVLNSSSRTRAVYLTLAVWVIAIIIIYDPNAPAPTTGTNIFLSFIVGVVFGLFVELWHMSRRLEAAILLLKINVLEKKEL